MRLVNLVIAASALISALGIINILLLWGLHPAWWKLKSVRIPAILLPIISIGSATIWALGHLKGWHPLTQIGAIVTPALFIIEISLLISLPFSGTVHSIIRVIDYFKRRSDGMQFSGGRRRFVKLAAAVFPAAAVSSSLAGVADSYAPIQIPTRKIPISFLPTQLEGFKIAHLSDLHLGYYVNLDNLQEAVEKIKTHQPDLALVTGDISDDLNILPEALKIISTLSPRFGTYASVGNHEYYRGIMEVMKIFKTAPFPMLINQHININVGGAKVTLGGADDPRTLRRDYTQFLENTIEHTLGEAPADSFKLLMCHRPEGFNYSVQKGIDLVLSGHTHGGQVGLGGRSVFEPLFPEKYLWGTYHRGKTTMYTSGGMGHWLPFRLGVPAEAPILILEKEILA
ncbi:MAG TPA: hypothetical protein DCZ43_02060 [candidate division Zixibacteria bacterium]|nr:hypothetical protein [candidate division Zixibacteria bacterium]